MGYECRILADSLSAQGIRLTTFQVTFPRIVLAEFNTHRMLSRNSASSRAIPVEKQIARVLDDPFEPIHWGKNQKGMQAEQELDADDQAVARMWWLSGRDAEVAHARAMLSFGVHKQITNRLLEPWMWHTVIVTATEWENFFNLRCHPAAQPEIRVIAEMMRAAYDEHHPMAVPEGDWHLPLVDFDDHAIGDIPKADLPLVCAGRCARVSYLTHDGRRDPQEDIALAKRLSAAGHMSPFEHAATPFRAEEWNLIRTLQAYAGPPADRGALGRMREAMEFDGNFRGWTQLRKMIPNEAVYQGGAK